MQRELGELEEFQEATYIQLQTYKAEMESVVARIKNETMSDIVAFKASLQTDYSSVLDEFHLAEQAFVALVEDKRAIIEHKRKFAGYGRTYALNAAASIRPVYQVEETTDEVQTTVFTGTTEMMIETQAESTSLVGLYFAAASITAAAVYYVIRPKQENIAFNKVPLI